MKFSVVVPTYNRISSLKQTLASLNALDFPDFEIIIVNDGSNDGTDAFLKEMSEKFPIRTCNGKHEGPAAARNLGIAEARGEWIAFTDDDCMVPPDWLKLFERSVNETGADFIGGSAENALPRNILSTVSQEMTSHYVRSLQQLGRKEFLTSNNTLYRASVLRSAGGFDRKFLHAGGEERDLNRRILAIGGTAAFRSDIAVRHAHRMNLVGWLRQQFNYGRGARMLRRLALLRGEASPSIPIPVHLSLCGALLRTGVFTGLVKVALFILAQTVTGLGYLMEAGVR